MKSAENRAAAEEVHARCAPMRFAFTLVAALVLAVGCAPPTIEPRSYDAELVLVTWPGGWVDEYTGAAVLDAEGHLTDPLGCELELVPIDGTGRVSVEAGVCEWVEPDGARVRLSWPEGEGSAREELHVSMEGELLVWGEGWAVPSRAVDYVLDGR